MGRGRPALEQILEVLSREVDIFQRECGGFPPSPKADRIWHNIWLEETHHSTALEGNTLTPGEVYRLVEEGVVTGSKELRHYLEVQGYAGAAAWVYEEATARRRQGSKEFTLAHVQHIHRMLMGPVWESYPPVSGDHAGAWRRMAVRIAGARVRPAAWTDVPALMGQWVENVRLGPGNVHPVEWAAVRHAEFEAVHPFLDGNGRAGRLAMNYLLMLYGYPPAIIQKAQRPRYLRALERAQASGETRALAELVARSVRDNLNRLLLPKLVGQVDLVPLSALAAGTPYNPAYLRRLAEEGRLRAVREGGLWLSCHEWLNAYVESRSPRGRRRKS